MSNLNKVNTEIRNVKKEMGYLLTPFDKLKELAKGLLSTLGIVSFVATLRNAVRISNELSSAQSNLAAVLEKN